MNKPIRWILGILSGIVLFVILQAIMLLFSQFIIYQSGILIGTLVTFIIFLFGSLLIIILSFQMVAYDIVKTKSMVLYNILITFLVLTCIGAVINHQLFDDLSNIPKWVYITLQIFYIIWSIALYKYVKKDLNKPNTKTSDETITK